jgi:malate synthase
MPPRGNHRPGRAQDGHQRLNSGADSYMTDFEDSNTPNWDNQITGQINMRDAVRRTISLEQNGKPTS